MYKLCNLKYHQSVLLSALVLPSGTSFLALVHGLFAWTFPSLTTSIGRCEFAELLSGNFSGWGCFTCLPSCACHWIAEQCSGSRKIIIIMPYHITHLLRTWSVAWHCFPRVQQLFPTVHQIAFWVWGLQRGSSTLEAFLYACVCLMCIIYVFICNEFYCCFYGGAYFFKVNFVYSGICVFKIYIYILYHQTCPNDQAPFQVWQVELDEATMVNDIWTLKNSGPHGS